MVAGILQLAAKGYQDIFLIDDPQITFFKVVFRRHSNFSVETIPQYFNQNPNFGQKTSCTISRSGDLIHKIYVVITLPQLFQLKNQYDPNQLDMITTFAWIRRIGYVLLKTISIELSGTIIDTHYGEWLNILFELTGPKNINFLKYLGEDPSINNFSFNKPQILLYVPLRFWFCESVEQALPIISLYYNEVKINIEFETLQNCLLVSPTNYITVKDDFAFFKPQTIIQQTINGITAIGIYSNFDALTKNLYYYKISNVPFQSISYDLSTVTNSTQLNEIYAQNSQYQIYSALTPDISVFPIINSSETEYFYNLPRNISLVNVFLLVDYIFIESNERVKLAQNAQEYLITQTTQIVNTTVQHTNRTILLSMKNSCKLMVWVAQLKYIKSYDAFNYTTNIIRSDGKNIITFATILFNGKDILGTVSTNGTSTLRTTDYFNLLQPYQHFPFTWEHGYYLYSFSLSPNLSQPAGSCNMSKIDFSSLQIQMASSINFNNPAYVRVYYVNYNILKIMHGLARLVFID